MGGVCIYTHPVAAALSRSQKQIATVSRLELLKARRLQRVSDRVGAAEGCAHVCQLHAELGCRQLEGNLAQRQAGRAQHIEAQPAARAKLLIRSLCLHAHTAYPTCVQTWWQWDSLGKCHEVHYIPSDQHDISMTLVWIGFTHVTYGCTCPQGAARTGSAAAPPRCRSSRQSRCSISRSLLSPPGS